MNDKFTLSAPIVWADAYEPRSGYSKLVSAIGRMLGGLLVDGAVFKFDGTDFSLAAVQLCLIESGIDLYVMGASYSVDGNSSFIAMTDGSVWRLKCYAKDGRIVTEGYKATDDEVSSDCQSAKIMHGAVHRLVLNSLANAGLVSDGDSWISSLVVDGHAAIVSRPLAYGVIVISNKDGTDKIGFKFSLDAPRNVDDENAAALLQFMPLDKDEIHEIKKKNMMAQLTTIEGSPFPQKVGVA